MVQSVAKISLLTIAVFIARLSATTLSGGSTQELARVANWIGRLQIEEIRTIPSSARFPFSEVKGKVLEVFKGSGAVGESIRIQIPGGQRGRSSFAIMGFPALRVNGEYVLFLDSAPQVGGTSLSLNSVGVGLTGWSAFRILNSEQRQSRVVIRAGEPSLTRGSAMALSVTHDRSVKTYDDFVSEIYRSLD